MKRQIYIIDYLGTESADKDYVPALKALLSRIPDCKVEILSNYSEEEGQPPFLFNQYKGGALSCLISLYRNYRRLMRLISEYPDAIFVFVAHGSSIDINFIRIVVTANIHLIDVLDESINNENIPDKLLYDFAKTYSQRVNGVILHSEATDDFLDEIGFFGDRLRMPADLSLKDVDDESLQPVLQTITDWLRIRTRKPDSHENE